METSVGHLRRLLQSIMECVETPVFTLDGQYRYTGYNQAHASVMKTIYGAEIRTGMSLLDAMTVAEDRETAKRNLDRAMGGERFTEAAFSGDPNLSRSYFQVSHSPIRGESGDVVGLAVFSIDDTRRNLVQTILDNLPDTVYLKDASNRMILLHEPGRAPPRSGREDAADAEVLRSGNGRFGEETEYRTREGVTGWKSSTRIPIRGVSGKPAGLIGVERDITVGKRAERTLRESEGDLRRAEELAHVGHWSWDTRTDRLIGSGEMRRILGLDPERHDDCLEAVIRTAVHPEDRDVAEHARRMVYAERRTLSLEFRVVHPDGLTRRVLWKPDRSVTDGDGRIERLFGIVQDVTEWRRLTEALKASEQRFSKAFHHNPDSVSIARLEDGVYQEVNEGFTRILGYTAEEAVGRSALPGGLGVWVMEDWKRLLAILTATGSVTSFQTMFRRKDRTVRQGIVSAGLLTIDSQRSVLSILRDETERLRTEEALRESEERYRSLFDHSLDAILLMAPDGSIREANPAACRLFGRSGEEIRRGGRSVIHDGADPRLALGGFTGESTFLRGDGTRFPGEFSSSVFQDRQGDLTISMILRDVSERKRAMETLRDRQRQLIQAEKMATLGVMIPTIAHEINNPNHIIRLNAQSLSGMCDSLVPAFTQWAGEGGYLIGGVPLAELGARMSSLLQGIEGAAERTESFLGTLRHYVRPDEDRDWEDTDLNLVVESALTLCSNLVSHATRHLAVHLSGDLPLIRGKVRRLEQVVINLLMNACQALTDPQQAVQVRTEFLAGTDKVLLTVRDEGRGMDGECLRRLKEPFFTTRLAEGGTGLGISIVNMIVEEHRGTLEFLSAPAQGTTVKAAFPAMEGH